MADPKNYLVKIKAGITRITLPGEGVSFTAGDEVEMSPRAFAQMRLAHLAAVEVLQEPNTGGISAAQLAALATDVEVAQAVSTKVEPAPTTTGTQAASQSTFAYQEIPETCQRGLMSRLTITPSGAGKYDLELRSGNGTGEIFLAATDADGVYDISIPVYVEGDVNGSLWLGIKNKGGSSRTYTVTTLRVEKFA